MKPVQAGQRMGALVMAISITFCFVWALANYAHAKPADSELSQAAKLALQKSCS
jgi:hypothetical protein